MQEGNRKYLRLLCSFISSLYVSSSHVSSLAYKYDIDCQDLVGLLLSLSGIKWN